MQSGCRKALTLPIQWLLRSVCVCARASAQVHLPNSGYDPGLSGLFFLPFPNRIWACSLKGEVVRSDWPGRSARSQETAPTSCRVALPSVSLAQPPYPNSEAVSLVCVSVSTGHACHTGWRGAGPRSRQAERAVSPRSI